ncbi:MAG TPA: thioredoxin family protein [Burkholderiaceae bacterium]|jgi:thioredoxin-related protein|nr:thioredoxin family protein [Burkholderiaceae bacterium]
MLARLLLSALMLLAAPAAFSKPPAEWKFQDWQAAVATAEKSQKPLFVLFGFEQCPYCDHLYRHGMDNPELRAKYQSSVVLAYYDTRAHGPDDPIPVPGGATMSHAQFIKHFRAYPTPSWLFLSPKGTVLLANRGSKSTSRDLVRDLDAALAASRR